jgi:hypothetical protein
MRPFGRYIVTTSPAVLSMAYNEVEASTSVFIFLLSMGSQFNMDL